MTFILRFFLILALPFGIAVHAEDNDTLALTYAYSAKESGSDLADGYKKHLEWHVANNDPILWYAWFVVEGDRLGHFVDGAFDVTGAEFDARPDPAGDAADATLNFAPHVNLEYRRIFRLRRDLSSSTFLEDRDPSRLMQVVYYHVQPGKQMEFEAIVQEIAFAANREGSKFTLYEMLTGGTGALYAVYVPLDGFASFDSRAVTLESIASKAIGKAGRSQALQRLATVVNHTVAEVWQFRADLSLIPDD